MLAIRATIITGIVILAGSASADTIEVGALTIDAPWARATPAAAPVAGGYLTITNNGDTADRLIAGAAAFAGRIEIHEMAMTDGVMRMRELADGLEIAPGETVVLEPGSYHVMFMQLAAPLVEGETRDVTLEFERAGSVDLSFAVRSLAAGRSDGSQESN